MYCLKFDLQPHITNFDYCFCHSCVYILHVQCAVKIIPNFCHSLTPAWNFDVKLHIHLLIIYIYFKKQRLSLTIKSSIFFEGSRSHFSCLQNVCTTKEVSYIYTAWLGWRRGAFSCVGWQVTLCDPIWQLCSGMSSLRAIDTFKLF